MPLISLVNHHYINLAFLNGNVFVILHLFMWIFLRLFFHAVCHTKFTNAGKTKCFPVDGRNATFMDAKQKRKKKKTKLSMYSFHIRFRIQNQKTNNDLLLFVYKSKIRKRAVFNCFDFILKLKKMGYLL